MKEGSISLLDVELFIFSGKRNWKGVETAYIRFVRPETIS